MGAALLPIGLGLGGSILGGLFSRGGGGGSSTPAPSGYENTLAQIAQDTYTQTDPLRQSLLQQMSSMLSGGFDPAKSATYAPMYASARTGTEAQYNVAKENVLGNTPRGGGQIDALANIEAARAGDVGSLPAMLSSQIMQDMMQKTYGTAFGAPQQSMAGLASAAGTYGNRMSMAQAAAAQQQSGLYGGLGQIGGMALGSMLGPGGMLGGKGAGKSLGGKK